MKKNKILSLSVLLLSAMVLTACGGSNKSAERATSNYNAAAYDSAVEESADYMEYADYEEPLSSGSGSVSTPKVNETNRKLIKNVDLDVETEDLDELLEKINDKINLCGGYVEYSNVYNGSSKGHRNASMTARIPAVKLDEFIDNVAENSNVTRQNINVSDVTLQYVDLEARKSSLDTQQKRLLELMEQAETVEDIITIEERLADIRYELESAERQIRSYDNQVDYSTVSISINEVTKYTPVAEKTRWQKMTEGFVESVMDVIENGLDFIVWFIVAIPHLFVFAVFVLIIVLIIKLIIKGNKKKAAKRMQERQVNNN